MFGLSFDDLQKYGSLLGFVGAIVGLVFTGLQVRRNTQIHRADFLLQLANRDLDKEGGWDLFFKIETGNLKIQDMQKFDGSKEAIALDALLYHFNLIGRMERMGVITIAEARFFKYEITTVLENSLVQDYLKWFQGHYKPKELYPDARSLAKRLGEKSVSHLFSEKSVSHLFSE